MVTLHDTISVIDCRYLYDGRAAAYLIAAGDEAAFVDNGTRFSVPFLLESLRERGLSPKLVRYVIVTHVHLDHCGGTAELLKRCPNATVLAHPRAGRHLADPSKLEAGARAIYGDRFDAIYGAIEPVDEARIEVIQDGGVKELGERRLTFIHTPGHARHHFAVIDEATNSIFAGDAFGLSYARLQTDDAFYIGYVCSPPDFDPEAAKATIRRIVDTGVERVFITHYGVFTRVAEGAEQVCRQVDEFDALADRAAETELTGAALEAYCESGGLEIIKESMRREGFDPGDEDQLFWATNELMVSAKGLAFLAEKRRGGR